VSEVQCLRIKLVPGTAERVSRFLRGLEDGPEEVARSLDAEGIVSESLFLERADEGEFLIFITRAHDLEAASAAFEDSSLPLDVETRRMIAETWEDARPLELLADLEA